MTFPRVKQVTITVEMEDGRISTTTSRLGALNQDEGVKIDQDREYFTLKGIAVDVTQRTTVTWVEQWTETIR